MFGSSNNFYDPKFFNQNLSYNTSKNKKPAKKKINITNIKNIRIAKIDAKSNLNTNRTDRTNPEIAKLPPQHEEDLTETAPPLNTGLKDGKELVSNKGMEVQMADSPPKRKKVKKKKKRRSS